MCVNVCMCVYICMCVRVYVFMYVCNYVCNFYAVSFIVNFSLTILVSNSRKPSNQSCKLCSSVYCLCVNVYCTVLLPPGVNPTAVNNISYHLCI